MNILKTQIWAAMSGRKCGPRIRGAKDGRVHGMRPYGEGAGGRMVCAPTERERAGAWYAPLRRGPGRAHGDWSCGSPPTPHPARDGEWALGDSAKIVRRFAGIRLRSNRPPGQLRAIRRKMHFDLVLGDDHAVVSRPGGRHVDVLVIIQIPKGHIVGNDVTTGQSVQGCRGVRDGHILRRFILVGHAEAAIRGRSLCFD